MPATFTSVDAVELATLDRNGFIESRHSGSAVVLSPTGDVVKRLGDPDAPVMPRSCMKPFQALAVLESGVELGAVQTVLATASHAGTPAHVEVVNSILAKAGLGADALQCPNDWPGDSGSRDELVRSHAHRASILMNCSGKHAAMLLACVVNGWPTESYLDPEHPLQQRVRAVVERETGESITVRAVDGCGAPVYPLSLTGLARGIGRITTATEGAAAQLTASVLANGWAIDGPGRANTLCIDRLGVFSKLGAEGVMVMSTTPATPHTVENTAGTTVALKMLDGSLRAATLVGLTLLASVGALSPAAIDDLRPHLDLTIFGGANPVGEIRVSPAVTLTLAG